MRQLTPLDAQFLAIETSRTYGHVGGLAVYDPSTAPGGRLGVPEICRLVSERVHMLPPFRWKLVPVPLGLDLPYWTEDEDFDLDFHIRESAVPPPGDDRQLAETVARIFARPLDRTRPLWELYLIQGLEGGRAALLTKVHHSVVDGVSGSEILTVLLDPSPEGREIEPPEDDGPPGRKPGDLEMLGRGLTGLARAPLRALRSVPTALPNLTELPGANAFPGVPALSRVLTGARRALGGPQDPGILEVTTARPPRTCFNGPISAHRSFAFGSVSLDTVKAIKNAAGVKVNDVVVAVCAGAVREFLLERDELPDEPLVAMVPVSVRAEDEQGTFGNRISTMIVPIPTDVADPVQRLERAHELLRSAKEHHAALPADLLTDASAFIPPAVAALAARTTVGILGRTRPPLNLVVSNVPGPRSPLFLAGARLEAHYPVSAVVDGVGLNMTVMSYLDHVDFGIVADRDQIADVWPLMRAAEREVERLAAELTGAPEAGAPDPRAGARTPARPL
jgi:diacylglycerol O-acyltransferase / wax synthase